MATLSEHPARTPRHGRAPPPMDSTLTAVHGARTGRHSPGDMSDLPEASSRADETVPRMERPERSGVATPGVDGK